MQNTISTAVGARGPGGAAPGTTRLRLCPAAPGEGLQVVRTDLPGRPAVPCRLETARWGETGLVLGTETWAVSGLVPLLAACQALAVDNLRIEVDGPAVPRLDGSAAPFVFLLRAAGRRRQGLAAARLQPGEVLCFTHATGRLSCGRGRGAYLSVAWAPRQSLGLALSEDVFVTQIARARPAPRGRLRWSDEPLRYALMESLAGMALCGGRFRGRLHWVGGDLRLHLDFWRYWQTLEERDPPGRALGGWG